MKCRRCGGRDHLGDQCEHFPYWKGKPCDCGLMHKKKECNTFRTSHLTELGPGEQDGQKDAPNMYLQ